MLRLNEGKATLAVSKAIAKEVFGKSNAEDSSGGNESGGPAGRASIR